MYYIPARRMQPLGVKIELTNRVSCGQVQYVGNKSNPRWLWHAIDHSTGTVLAYVFGRRQDEVFLKLKALLEPFGLTHYYTDKWGAYTRHLDPEQHTASKRYTQKIEVRPVGRKEALASG
jgi:IS1 family transposase